MSDKPLSSSRKPRAPSASPGRGGSTKDANKQNQMDTEEVLAVRRRDRSGTDTSGADPKKQIAETAPDSAEGGSTEEGQHK
eukprot:6521058-Prymnesium_polylepis.1